jgi:hypothetical protein
MKVINNCLNKEELVTIQNLMINNEFPWFITWGISNEKNKDYQFTHTFHNGINITSDYFNLIDPFIKILKPSSFIRIKANLLLKTNEIIKHGYHIDNKVEKSKTAIFYINNNNGFTQFENNEISKSEENKLIIFDTDQKHTGTTCTDALFRIVINFNYV